MHAAHKPIAENACGTQTGIAESAPKARALACDTRREGPENACRLDGPLVAPLTSGVPSDLNSSYLTPSPPLGVGGDPA